MKEKGIKSGEERRINKMMKNPHYLEQAKEVGLVKSDAESLPRALAEVAINFGGGGYICNFKEYADWLSQGSAH